METYQRGYVLKILEVGGDIYENVEVPSRAEFINAVEQSKVIAVRWMNKKIYINGNYVVSFQEN